MFKGTISLMTALEITVLSMFVVFLILSLLAFILSLFKHIPQEKIVENKVKPKQDLKTEPVQRAKFDPSKITDERMLVAMLVATIEASKDENNSNVRVVGIKELN